MPTSVVLPQVDDQYHDSIISCTAFDTRLFDHAIMLYFIGRQTVRSFGIWLSSRVMVIVSDLTDSSIFLRVFNLSLHFPCENLYYDNRSTISSSTNAF